MTDEAGQSEKPKERPAFLKSDVVFRACVLALLTTMVLVQLATYDAVGKAAEEPKSAPEKKPATPAPAVESGRFGGSEAEHQRSSLLVAVSSGRASLAQMYALKAACVKLQDMACATIAVAKIKEKKAAAKKTHGF